MKNKAIILNKKFGIIGVGGYIAPRHLKAIKDLNNDLLVAVDPSDSVGILDSFYPETSFFTIFERFDRHIEMLKYDKKIFLDYISICSPNYLHDAHIRFALRSGADAICEKPLVTSIHNLDRLINIEETTSNKVHAILQLRDHKNIIDLKTKYSNTSKIADIELTYITSRGKWYDYSWKGDIDKSGGIATNIGVHFFDMLHWIFGEKESIKVHINKQNINSGYLKVKNANIKWFLSTDQKFIPKNLKEKGQSTYRSIKINGDEIEFSDGFSDLHTKVYEKILKNEGYGIKDTYSSIQTVDQIRFMEESPLKDEYHEFCKKI